MFNQFCHLKSAPGLISRRPFNSVRSKGKCYDLAEQPGTGTFPRHQELALLHNTVVTSPYLSISICPKEQVIDFNARSKSVFNMYYDQNMDDCQRTEEVCRPADSGPNSNDPLRGSTSETSTHGGLPEDLY